MGANESQPVRNMDKRTCRREYKEDYENAIVQIRRALTNDPVYSKENAVDNSVLNWNNGNIRVCVRKRPIFSREIQGGEFDVAFCPESKKKIIIHDARMHSDMKRQYIDNFEFGFDRVFDETTNNHNVYEVAAAPLVKIAYNGGYATCMVYGQTGSGKTFTMTSIYEEAAKNIFRLIHDNTSKLDSLPEVSLSFFELSGDTVSDLLGSYKEAKLISGVDGSVHPFPVVEVPVADAEELLSMIQFARNIRTTAATGVHDASSRSHAILRIYIQRQIETKPEDKGKKLSLSDLNMNDSDKYLEGTLTLVDLAGSEHRIDSMYHNADRRKEGALINSSLMALKDCIRSKFQGENAQHNYRKSKLTMALKGAFTIPEARTVVIATISPSSKDTEHSLNTIRHACMMDGQHDFGANASESRFMTGGKVTRVEMGAIDVSDLVRKNRMEMKRNGEVHALKTSNGNIKQDYIELSEKEKLRIRRQAEKNAYNVLNPRSKEALNNARKNRHGNNRQFRRMRVAMQELAAIKMQQEEEAMIKNSNERNEGEEDAELDDEPNQFHNNREPAFDLLGKANKDENILAHISPPKSSNKPSSASLKVRKTTSNNSNIQEESPNLLKSDSKMLLVTENENIADIFSKPTNNSNQSKRRSNNPNKIAMETEDRPELYLQSQSLQTSPRLSQASNPPTLARKTSASSASASAAGTGQQNSERKAPSRREAQSPIPPCPEEPPPLDKQAAAKARREKLIDQQKQALMTKLQEKGNVSNGSTSYNKNDIDELENLVLKLEDQLNDPTLSKVTLHGINQQIMKHRATILREKNNYAQKYKRNDTQPKDNDQGEAPQGHSASQGYRSPGASGIQSGYGQGSPNSPVPPPPTMPSHNSYNDNSNASYNYREGRDSAEDNGGSNGGYHYDDNSMRQQNSMRNRGGGGSVAQKNSRNHNNNDANSYQPDFNNRPSVRSNQVSSTNSFASQQEFIKDDYDPIAEDPFISSLRSNDPAPKFKTKPSSNRNVNSKIMNSDAFQSSNTNRNTQLQRDDSYQVNSNTSVGTNNRNNSITKIQARDGAGNYSHEESRGYNPAKYESQSQYETASRGGLTYANKNSMNENYGANYDVKSSTGNISYNSNVQSRPNSYTGNSDGLNKGSRGYPTNPDEQMISRSNSASQFSANATVTGNQYNQYNQYNPSMASASTSSNVDTYRGRGRYRGPSTLGAASAPFGNAYND